MSPIAFEGSPLFTRLQVKAVSPSRLPRIAAKSSVGRPWMDMVSKGELLPQPSTARRVFEETVKVLAAAGQGKRLVQWVQWVETMYHGSTDAPEHGPPAFTRPSASVPGSAWGRASCCIVAVNVPTLVSPPSFLPLLLIATAATTPSYRIARSSS